MTLKKFNFNVIQKDDYSRCGLIETHRGNIQTPAFMPVGTQATVKATFMEDIIKTGSEIVLSSHDCVVELGPLYFCPTRLASRPTRKWVTSYLCDLA